MAPSKTDIIREFLAEHPNATGKEAEAALKKHGIKAQYFYTIKSNLLKRQGGTKKKRAKKKAVGTTVRRKIRRTAPPPTLEDLQTVADFANEFGGLDKLSAAVETLWQFQMKAS